MGRSDCRRRGSIFADGEVPGRSWAIPVLGGSMVALLTVILLKSPAIWPFLVPAGLAVAVGSLAARDFKRYWLSIYAFLLPLELKKMLSDSEPVQEFILRYGFPVGELPGAVLYLSDLPLFLLLAYWLFEIVAKKKKILFPRSNGMAVAFLIWSGASLLNAEAISPGLFELIRMLKLYMLYLYVVNNIATKETLNALLRIFLIGVLLQGMLCLFQYVTQDTGLLFRRLSGFSSDDVLKKLNSFFRVSESGAFIRRASGTAGAGNAEALYFEFFLPAALLLGLSASTLRGRMFNFAVFASGVLGLVLTFSRGSFVGIAVAISAVLIIARRNELVSKKIFLLAAFLGMSLLVVLSPFAYRFLMTRPEATLARFQLNRVGFAMIADHPVLGVGLNNHLIVKAQYDQAAYVFPMPTHNHFILVASQVGVPGAIFFAGFLISTFRAAWTAAASDDRFLGAVATGIVGSLIAIILHVQVDYLGTYTTMSLLWIFAGLAAVLARWRVNALPNGAVP